MFSASSIRIPSCKKIVQLSERIGCNLSREEVCQYQEVVASMLKDVDEIDALPEPSLPVKYPRTPGYRPTEEENVHRAWYWRTSITGAKEGILKGKRVALKDTIALAGVPMMAGSLLTEGYIPEFDATVTTRILDSGGEIIGKSTCEDWCYSDSSFTAARGPVLNPIDKTRTAGGSSSGSAVLVATGDVDMALGGDQGGSIRTPASCCGIVGLKPTHGLVPYTGILPIDFSLDHVGPMARKVYDCALLLEAIAGYDGGLDPRQPETVKGHQYTKELRASSLKGINIGILKEGFSQENSDSRVDALVKKSAFQLISVDAKVQEVSVPMHVKGKAITSVLGVHSVVDTMLRGGCKVLKKYSILDISSSSRLNDPPYAHYNTPHLPVLMSIPTVTTQFTYWKILSVQSYCHLKSAQLILMTLLSTYQVHDNKPSVCIKGLSHLFRHDSVAGTGYKGFYPTSWIDAIGRSLQSQPDDLPPTVKVINYYDLFLCFILILKIKSLNISNLQACWMLGEYLKHEYRNRYYAKAQNIARHLTADFEKTFEKFDVIAMPTLSFLPPKLPSSDLSIKEYITEALFDNRNVHTFNATGHPALSINASFIDDLPVGMMLVGKKFEENKLLKVAYAFEKLRDKIAAQ
ncbi:amidase-like [Antedon mediterranea]|uniref:amidase-like n=1 Tax=Antedon mediterranea TaxID=105859 RepID=UPI003AF47A70